jgi:hypothetical protein
MTTSVVRASWYKFFAESFFNGLAALRQAMLDSALLYHWTNFVDLIKTFDVYFQC